MLKQNCALPSVYNFVKRFSLLCTVLFCSASLFAQFKIRIELTGVPSSHKDDPVFVAGNFNEWKPGNTDYKFLMEDSKIFLEIKNVPAGEFQFKFTRGGWDKVECTADGKDVANHVVKIISDSLASFSIAGWKDDFSAEAVHHTASEHVQVMDTDFDMPQLNRQRRIWLYLPEGYAKSKKHYPVLYMHDGQNLFDAATSGYGEWGVDECLDSLIDAGKPPCIVVGIDNDGEKRMNEYNPYEFTWKDSASSITFAPEGDKYLDFIVHTLKPYIDKHYRTLSSKENTIIAGSSMGGLISYYAMLKYPSVFTKAGIFSPAFWTAEGLGNATDSFSHKLDAKFFFYMGEPEGKKDIDLMISTEEKIGEESGSVIYSVIDPEGKHNEAAWHKWFPAFYVWIMADGTNVPAGLNNNP